MRFGSDTFSNPFTFKRSYVDILKGDSQPINTGKISKYISTYVLFNADQTFN